MLRTLRTLAFCICWLALVQAGLHAQGLAGLLSNNKGKAAAPADGDALRRTTPRAAIYAFLEACHHGKFEVAAQYLDLRHLPQQERAIEGPRLAQELSKLLDGNPRFEVGQLSDSPEGDTSDGLNADLENLATFDLEGEPLTLQLERVTEAQIGAIWLISPASISAIPRLTGTLEPSWLEKQLPAPLVNTRLIGTPIWAWIALLLIAIILSAISRLLSRFLIAIAKPITRHYAKTFHAERLQALTEPLRLLISVVVFRACMVFVPTSALLRDDLTKLLILLFMLGAAALVMRLVDVISDTIISRLDHRERALTYSVFPLSIRIIKIVIFCFALLIVLQQWGYNMSAILAGIGVGGIAVALAAQKTIENLFGGVSLITDRPVLVGDFCRFGDQVGTVEDIGLRSTRIRTLDRTVVTIPNSQFSTLTLENFSKRDRMWFHPTLRLRRDTNAEQVQQMISAIQQILEKHEMVDAGGVPLRLTKIADQSLDLDIFAYVLTPDYNQYLKVQTDLLLKFLEASHNLGIGFAVPFQEQYNVSADTSEPADAPHPFLAFRSKATAQNGNTAEPNSGERRI